ncbi:hypothetical protein Acsp05_17100 [Actinokineospora sp. NBRC 105648]|nr:hypothetical protein Acsp05_17100 [Actinokineospora sp. NBRC 105648]
MQRSVRALAAVVGVALIGAALVVWWAAESALPRAPEVHWSSRGGMSWCAGATDCAPPVISGGTVAVIVVLAVLGVALVAAVVVDVAVRRRAGPAAAG